MRQRLTIAAGLAICATLWFVARGSLIAADGASGLTMTSSASGTIIALLVTLLTAVPIALVAAVASAGGHPLSGLFVASASLIILAVAGGPIDGWLFRLENPSDYRLLALEMVFWQIGAMAILVVTSLLRRWLRNRWSWLASDDHLTQAVRLGRPSGNALLAGVVSAAVSGIVTMILLRSQESGQVIGALLLAFAAGGAAGQSACPNERNPLVMLLSPMIVACAAYLYVSTHYASADALRQAWFNQTTPGAGLGNRLLEPAMALPVHYISAAMAGTIIGIGSVQAVQASQKQAAESAA